MGDIRNKIGLGTVQFGMEYGISNQSGQTPPNEVSSILASFRKKGGNLIDTAIAYGSSEIVLGNAGVGEFSVISKFMPPRSEERRVGKECRIRWLTSQRIQTTSMGAAR